MGTDAGKIVRVDQALVAVVDINDGVGVASSLQNKGFGQVALATHPRDTFNITRDGLVHVVCLADGGQEEVLLLRSLKEGPTPPRVVAVAEFGSLRQELENCLSPESRPDVLLVKPVPTVALVHEIEQQLLQCSIGDRLAQEAPLFAEVVAGLWAAKCTGMLHVIASGKQAVIYFREGRPLFAEGGTPADMLGRILVESGRITEGQLSQAVELMTSRLVDNEQLRLGGALVALGFLTASELFRTLTVQVRRKLLTCFGWRQISAEFREGEEYLEGVTEFANAVPALLTEGVGQMHQEDVECFLDRLDEQYPTCSAAAREIEQSFGLGGRERRLLDGIDGTTTVRQLRDVAAADAKERTAQLLMALILGRALTLASQPSQPATSASEGQKPKPLSPPISRHPIYGSARKVPGDDLDDDDDGGRLRSLLDKLRKPRGDR